MPGIDHGAVLASNLLTAINVTNSLYGLKKGYGFIIQQQSVDWQRRESL